MYFYRYNSSGDGWKLIDTITASDGQDNEYFGQCVGFNDTTMVIGARGVIVDAIKNAGAVYFYTYSTANRECKIEQRYDLENPMNRCDMGHSAAITDSRVVIGQPAGSSDSGTACLFPLNE